MIVTHDQQEALVMADRIVVLNNGHIEQIGTPEEIYQKPATPFVADFMGADNRITAEEIDALGLASLNNNGEQDIYFRSSDAALSSLFNASFPESGLMLEGVVEQNAFIGHNYRYAIRCQQRLFHADSVDNLPLNTKVRLHVPESALHIFSPSHTA